jgi:hypothetical protein
MPGLIFYDILELSGFKNSKELSDAGHAGVRDICSRLEELRTEPVQIQTVLIRIIRPLTVAGSPQRVQCTAFELEKVDQCDNPFERTQRAAHFLLDHTLEPLDENQQMMMDYLLQGAELKKKSLADFSMQAVHFLSSPGDTIRETTAHYLKNNALSSTGENPPIIHLLNILRLGNVIGNSAEREIVTAIESRKDELRKLPLEGSEAAFYATIYMPNQSLALPMAQALQWELFEAERKKNHQTNAARLAMEILQVIEEPAVARAHPAAQFLQEVAPRVFGPASIRMAEQIAAGDPEQIGIRNPAHPQRVALRDVVRRGLLMKLVKNFST